MLTDSTLSNGLQNLNSSQLRRQRYMDRDMTYNTMDKDGHVRTLPLFADIDVSIHLVILLVYFSQHNLLRSHSSSPRRLRLRKCVSKASFRRIAHLLGTRSGSIQLLLQSFYLSVLVCWLSSTSLLLN